MFSHIMVGSNDIDASKTFYDALFLAAGAKEGTIDPKGRLVYVKDGGRFMVSRPLDGQPATCGNGGTIGFALASADMVDAWHAAGAANGGISIENPPGVREGARKLYLAYLRDPSGNKLCGGCVVA